MTAYSQCGSPNILFYSYLFLEGNFGRLEVFQKLNLHMHYLVYSYNSSIKEVCLLFPFIYISWRLITLKYCSGFCHTLLWISHGLTCAPHPVPPLTSFPIPSLWVIPVHQPWALVSCIKPGLVICFTLDNIHVLMLFSQIIPPSPSPTESKSLFCTSVSLFPSCI